MERPVFKTERFISVKKLIIGVALFIVVGGAVGFGIFYYSQYKNLKDNPTSAVDETNKKLLTRLGKIMELPKDEQPQIAAVTDREKLGEDPFFTNAKNGDYLVVYSKARKIIIYRDSENKIINQGPFSINTSGKVKVALMNAGVTSAGLEAAQKSINQALGTDLGVIDTANSAKKTSYTKNIVVDVTGGQRAVETQKIAQVIGAEIQTTLPTGEVQPQDTEVVVILAK